MNDALTAAATALAQRTRAEQGLPLTVVDPTVLARVATLITGTCAQKPNSAGGTR